MLPSIIIFLIVLSILVFIHEFGHFLAAKKSGIKVEEFGFGYPPKIWGKKIGETIYSLNLIPFGGFVRLLGQEYGEKKKFSAEELKRSFFSKSKKKRALVLISGILGNFLLGLACFSFIYTKIGIPQKLNYVKILEIIPGSPADQAGLQVGDQIHFINETQVYTSADFMKIIEAYKGQEITLTTQIKDYILMPRENPPPNEGRLGVVITDTDMVFHSWWQMPFLGIWEGLKETGSWSLLIIQGLIMTVKQLATGIVPEVSGPVGIFQLTSAAAKEGWLNLVQFVGILSVNLGVLNLMPFPALDGGHLVLVFAGDFLGKKRRAKIEQIINTAGLIFLLTLMVLVTINDLVRVFKNSGFTFLKSLVNL